ncbi:MAG: SET domain-containing protein-lysine N-methyltransferase [Betaproteobacteria bacterium]|nr:SET domain-containing protein-lysine N-methyltransferase [Betaproteobacteria bacterium]
MPSSAKKPVRAWRVLQSPVHGRGVFAARTIRKGETVIEYRGKRMSWDEACEQPASDDADPYHTFLFSLDDGRVIDAAIGGNAARWINHSCAPNCETYEDDRGRVYVAARRKIRPGEELSYDYRLEIEGKVGKRMRKAYACRCGARRCRGTMLA